MDLRSWPLSAAATRLLLDLHPDRPAAPPTASRPVGSEGAALDWRATGGRGAQPPLEARPAGHDPGGRHGCAGARVDARSAPPRPADHYELKGSSPAPPNATATSSVATTARDGDSARAGGLAAPARRRAGGLLPRGTSRSPLTARSGSGPPVRPKNVPSQSRTARGRDLEVDDREVATLGALMLLAGDGLPAAAKVAASRRRRHESGVMPAGPAGPQGLGHRALGRAGHLDVAGWLVVAAGALISGDVAGGVDAVSDALSASMLGCHRSQRSRYRSERGNGCWRRRVRRLRWRGGDSGGLACPS